MSVAKPRPTTRGGSRNRGDRETFHIAGRHAANLLAAAAYAPTMHLPLNRMITIHWEEGGIPPGQIVQATGRFIDLLSKCVARHSGQLAAVWVQEGGWTAGAHVHVLAHIPPQAQAAVLRLQRAWVSRITARPYRARVLRGRWVQGHLMRDVHEAAFYAVNLRRAIDYFLKGTEVQDASKLNIRRLALAGQCIGKRCGTTVNLGATRRSSNGRLKPSVPEPIIAAFLSTYLRAPGDEQVASAHCGGTSLNRHPLGAKPSRSTK